MDTILEKLCYWDSTVNLLVIADLQILKPWCVDVTSVIALEIDIQRQLFDCATENQGIYKNVVNNK